jgi:hypothetical protein
MGIFVFYINKLPRIKLEKQLGNLYLNLQQLEISQYGNISPKFVETLSDVFKSEKFENTHKTLFDNFNKEQIFLDANTYNSNRVELDCLLIKKENHVVLDFFSYIISHPERKNTIKQLGAGFGQNTFLVLSILIYVYEADDLAIAYTELLKTEFPKGKNFLFYDELYEQIEYIPYMLNVVTKTNITVQRYIQTSKYTRHYIHNEEQSVLLKYLTDKYKNQMFI